MNVIVAPHLDDECIGAGGLITKKETVAIFLENKGSYDENLEERIRDATKITEIYLGVDLINIPHIIEGSFSKRDTFLFPDPIFEYHPEHRLCGNVGLDLFHKGYKVIFYSINMMAPYIHEVEDPKEKRSLLDELYPYKCDLWHNDNKYFLFEGYCKYLKRV